MSTSWMEMNKQEYEIMYELEDAYWWYVGIRKILSTLLDTYYRDGGDLEILDAGCGTGATMKYLACYGRFTGVDISEEAIRFCHERGFKGNQAFRASILDLPFTDGFFDLVISLDVICNIKDDVAAFREIGRVLKRGGRLMVHLPAYQFLWSEHDEAVHHQARYTKGMLGRKMEQGGLKVERITYVNAFLFPALAVVRILKKGRLGRADRARSDLAPLPPAINRALSQVLLTEAQLIRRVDLPYGLSLLGIARK